MCEIGALRRLQREYHDTPNVLVTERPPLIASKLITGSLQHCQVHKNIQHTVRYTELTSKRFDKFWKD